MLPGGGVGSLTLFVGFVPVWQFDAATWGYLLW
jgi:hypothetical protein